MSPVEVLACPVCGGRLDDRTDGIGCANCDLHYAVSDGVYLLGPSLPRKGGAAARSGTRVERLDGEPSEEDAARAEPAAGGSEEPSRTGWKFLVGLRPGSRILVLGPTRDADARGLAREAAQMIVLDRDLAQLKEARREAIDGGLHHLLFARVIDALKLPLPDGSVDLAVVPGLADWFAAVAGRGRIRLERAGELLRELRRVLAPQGQAWIGADNRFNPFRILRPLRRPRIGYTAGSFRRAAHAAGFRSCRLYAPLPFRHRYFQIVDLDRTDAMNFCADPYRTHGRTMRTLANGWEVANATGGLERRLYPYVPDLGGVLSVDPTTSSFAERLLDHLGHGAPTRIERYYLRPKGVAVLVAVGPEGGRVIRLPLAEQAERACRRHHGALETLAHDPRLPASLRGLFPVPLGAGRIGQQAYFVESMLTGESGRSYYARPVRRYERALAQAAGRLADLRLASQDRVTIDEREFERLCGGWLRDLRAHLPEEQRRTLDRVLGELRETLLGATLPLGWYHGDYDFANLLYDRGDRLAGIIDFELFDARGLPLVDLMVLLARRAVRRRDLDFGTLFLSVILPRALPRLEAELLGRELESARAGGRLYRALALCCWLEHVRLRRDSWLVRSRSWRRTNVDQVLGWLATAH